MRKLGTLTASALFALGVGFGGTAQAQTELLTNGGAEDGDLTGWVASSSGLNPATPIAATGIDTTSAGVHSGTYAFDMDPLDGTGVGPDETATLTQTVADGDLDGCNLNINGVDLQGTWVLDGWYVAQNEGANPSNNVEDFGTISVEFFGGGGLFIERNNLVSADQDVWTQIDPTSGTIPVGTTSVDVAISGTEKTSLTGNFANVGWDDVSLMVDCVDENVKISGKFSPDGKRPTHVFGGAVGLLDGGDTVAGSFISVSYKKSLNVLGAGQNVACEFTEGGGTTGITATTATLTDWSYECDDPGSVTGTADLVLVDNDADPPRGSIEISDATHTDLHVDGFLITGNVFVE